VKNSDRKLLRQELVAVVRDLPEPVIDEMAIPSYTHWNPLIRWLMWKRLAVVQQICSSSTVDTAVDFGTGSGVMLPFLSRMSSRVIAIDKCTEPARRLCEARALRNVHVHFADGTSMPLPKEERKSLFVWTFSNT